MPLGTAQALNYQFPFPAMPQEQQQVPVAGMSDAPDMGVGGDLSGLQYVQEGGLAKVEGDTSAVYDKYHKLRSFVSSMWKNYGIDVTNPDFNDPISIEANKLYQKTVADLHFTIEDLKNSQKMLAADAAKAGRRLAEGVNLQAQPYSQVVGQAFVSEGISDEAKSYIQAYQNNIWYDKDSKAAAQGQLDKQRQFFEQRANEMEKTGRLDLADQFRRDAAAIGDAIYSDIKDKEFALDAQRNRLYGMANQPKGTAFHVEFDKMKSLTDRDDIRTYFGGGTDTYDVIDAYRTGDGKFKLVRRHKSGKEDVITVDPDSKKSFYNYYNQFRNPDLSWDDVLGLNPKIIPIPGIAAPIGDIAPNFKESQDQLAGILQGAGYNGAANLPKVVLFSLPGNVANVPTSKIINTKGEEGKTYEQKINAIGEMQHAGALLQHLANVGNLRMIGNVDGKAVNEKGSEVDVISKEGNLITNIDFDIDDTKGLGAIITLTDETGSVYKIDLSKPEDWRNKANYIKNADILKKFINDNALAADMAFGESAGTVGDGGIQINKGKRMMLTDDSGAPTFFNSSPSFGHYNWYQMAESGRKNTKLFANPEEADIDTKDLKQMGTDENGKPIYFFPADDKGRYAVQKKNGQVIVFESLD